MKNAGGLWSFYQGDINQDEGINLTDVLAVYNDASNYVSGPYNVSDLNYDGFVDLIFHNCEKTITDKSHKLAYQTGDIFYRSFFV
ncbi:MAG: hypothetical protein IPL53_07010 [Ignavibacteria bacterium]|nr:hypothetical protein [Ignavibacteria bacterium]